MVFDVIATGGVLLFAYGLLRVFEAKTTHTASDEQAKRKAWQDSEGMPEELRGSLLAMNEDWVSASVTREGKPAVRMKGRVDQAFELQDENKALVLADTKNRESGKVLKKDVVQLSCYAYMLTAQGRRVLNRAYLRMVRTGGKLYRPIKLIPPAVVERIYDRYHAIRQGRVKPIANPDKFRCRYCEFEQRCPKAWKNKEGA